MLASGVESLEFGVLKFSILTLNFIISCFVFLVSFKCGASCFRESNGEGFAFCSRLEVQGLSGWGCDALGIGPGPHTGYRVLYSLGYDRGYACEC